VTKIHQEEKLDNRLQIEESSPLPTLVTINAAIKRLFDIIFAIIGLLFLTPVFAVIAFAIRRDSPGPIFYEAERVGRSGKLFKMLKFRSMYEQPENNNGSPLTTKDDARVTPIGKWLRATKFNELPQLWNVLKGEMSLVGPRPEDPQFVNSWNKEAKQKILSMRPGITSPASVIYRDEERLLSSRGFLDDYLKQILPDKQRLDQLYVDNNSLVNDLDVLFMTLIAFLPRLRTVSVKEKWLYSGAFYTITHRILSWFFIDFVVVLLSIGLAGLTWRLSMPLNLGVPTFLIGALLASIFLSLINTSLGLHRIKWEKASPTYVIDITISVSITMLFLWIINRFWLTEPRILFTFFWMSGLMVSIGLIAVRFRDRLITGLANRWILMRGSNASFGERMLVIGAGELGELAIWMLKRSPFLDLFSVIGLVDDDPRKLNIEFMGYKVLGTTQEIPELVKRYNIGLILFSIANCPPAKREQILARCDATKAKSIIIPDLIEVLRQSLEKLEE